MLIISPNVLYAQKLNMWKKLFKPITSKQIELLELIHSDPTNFKDTVSKGGQRYYVTFADDNSRYTKLNLLRSKNEDEEIFSKYKAEVEN